MPDDLPSGEQKDRPYHEGNGTEDRYTTTNSTPGAPETDKFAREQSSSLRYLRIAWEWVRFSAWQKVIWPTMRSSEFWTALATVIIAVFTGLTYEIVNNSAHDTQKLITAAQSQARSASVMANAADRIRRAAQDMVHQDQRIADNAKQSLDASTSQSKTALDASIQSSHLDQRAWLVFSTIRMSGEPTQRAGATVTVSIANTGKTPALKFINQSRLVLLDIDPSGPDFKLPVNPRSRAIVAPGVSGVQFTTNRLTLKSLKDIALYESGDDKIYIQALIRYNDIFNRPHWTSLCAYHVYEQRLDDFQYCQHGNDVDGEKEHSAPQ